MSDYKVQLINGNSFVVKGVKKVEPYYVSGSGNDGFGVSFEGENGEILTYVPHSNLATYGKAENVVEFVPGVLETWSK